MAEDEKGPVVRECAVVGARGFLDEDLCNMADAGDIGGMDKTGGGVLGLGAGEGCLGALGVEPYSFRAAPRLPLLFVVGAELPL